MYIVELNTTIEVDQTSGDNGCASHANGTSKKVMLHCILYTGFYYIPVNNKFRKFEV